MFNDITSLSALVFVRFWNEEHGVEAVVCAKTRNSDENTYAATINIGSLEAEFLQYKSGEYKISIITGDMLLTGGKLLFFYIDLFETKCQDLPFSRFHMGRC